MEPIVAVMLILGCDHSMMVCRQADQPVHYASVESCEADKDLRVRFVDNYPMAVAECIEVPELGSDRKVVIDWRVDAAGGLLAEARLRDVGPLTAKAELRTTAAGGV